MVCSSDHFERGSCETPEEDILGDTLSRPFESRIRLGFGTEMALVTPTDALHQENNMESTSFLILLNL